MLRWFTAAVLLGIAAALLGGVRAPTRAVTGTPVLVAARDLSPGRTLGGGDVRLRTVPRELVPKGALRGTAPAVGRTAAGPVRAGEVLTDVRLLGPGLTVAVGGTGAVAAPVRFADAGAVALLRPADRLDVVATATEQGSARATHTVAADVQVLSVPPARSGDPADGALVVLAASPHQARGLAHAEVSSRLSFTVRSH